MDVTGGTVGVFGIDFGTTNCCAAIYITASGSTQVKVLENYEGVRTTSSFVFFTEQNSVLVGNHAKRMGDAKPDYGVYEIKRLLGHDFNDPSIRNNVGYFTFDIVNENNVPTIVIEHPKHVIKKTAEELATIIFKKIKMDVEDKFEKNPANKVVVTVPAYFNSKQREAVYKSAQNAGFTVLKLLNEPTASALAYFYENTTQSNRTNTKGLVFDLGGGTLDVAVLQHEKTGNINILAVDGDCHLGGQDLDNLLVVYVVEILKKDYNSNPESSRRTMKMLKNKCEQAKIDLSSFEETTIELTALPNLSKDDITIPLTRQKFEELSMDLLNRSIDLLGKCLDKSQLSRDDIDVIIMAGGSTRIPKLQKMISAYFNGKKLNKFVNPDECVAVGAAIQAAMLSKHPLQAITEMKVTDVIPLSIGLGDFVDVMSFIIKKNTPIPVSRQVSRVTVYDNQTSVKFDVYEGERLNCKRNYYLGTLELSDITPAPPGKCEILVTIGVDANGFLSLKGEEVLSGKTRSLTLSYTRGHKNDEEISAALRNARENQRDDEEFKQFTDHKSYVIKYCVRARHNFEKLNLTEQHSIPYKICEEILEKAKGICSNVSGIEEISGLRKQVESTCDKIVKMYAFQLMP